MARRRGEPRVQEHRGAPLPARSQARAAVARADGDDGACRSDLLLTQAIGADLATRSCEGGGHGPAGRGGRSRLRSDLGARDAGGGRIDIAEPAGPTAKRRILHVVPGLGHGGAEHQLLMNIEKLDGSRFESHVVHLYPRTQLAPLIEAAGARVHSVASSGPFGTAQRIFKLARLIRRLDIDLVHTSNVDGELHGGIAGRMTACPSGTPTNIAGEQVRLVDNPYLNVASCDGRSGCGGSCCAARTTATSRYPTASRSRPYASGTAAGCRRSHLPGHAGWWARSEPIMSRRCAASSTRSTATRCC